MTDEHIDKLWQRLSSASNIKHLEYDEAVTIGGVFGEMKVEIKALSEALEFYADRKSWERDDPYEPLSSDIARDGGDKARQALKGDK